jgi:hypothetical protein
MVPGIQTTELLSVSKVVDCEDLSMDVGVSGRPERGLKLVTCSETIAIPVIMKRGMYAVLLLQKG